MVGQTSDEPGGGGIQSVLNALRIMESIADHQPVGVSQIARDVGLPKSSVQRALRTLEQAAWIRPVGGDQTRWGLTSWLLAVSLKAFDEYSLRDHALPAMEELRRRTDETIHLVSLDVDRCLVIERVHSQQAVRAFVEVGSHSPLHGTGSGQAIMAFLPEARVLEILAAGLPAHTRSTFTDPARILARLAEVRERGYSVNVGEWRPEVASISSPIMSVNGQPVAAISISIPINRFAVEDVETYGGWVRELTRGLVAPGRRSSARRPR